VSTPEETLLQESTYILSSESMAEMNKLTLQDRLLTREYPPLEFQLCLQ